MYLTLIPLKPDAIESAVEEWWIFMKQLYELVNVDRFRHCDTYHSSWMTNIQNRTLSLTICLVVLVPNQLNSKREKHVLLLLYIFNLNIAWSRLCERYYAYIYLLLVV